MAFLTQAQLSLLDGYEGAPYVYDRRQFDAQVRVGGQWRAVTASAYIKVDSTEWHAPSEAYCCAVLRNIRGSFSSADSLMLRDCEGQVRGEWRHPGHANLGFGALLFEVGVRQPRPWEMPRTIGQHTRTLASAGVTEGRALAEMSSEGNPLSAAEMGTLHRLLARGDGGEQSEDDDAQLAEHAESAGSPAGRSAGAVRLVRDVTFQKNNLEDSCCLVLKSNGTYEQHEDRKTGDGGAESTETGVYRIASSQSASGRRKSQSTGHEVVLTPLHEEGREWEGPTRADVYDRPIAVPTERTVVLEADMKTVRVGQVQCVSGEAAELSLAQ